MITVSQVTDFLVWLNVLSHAVIIIFLFMVIFKIKMPLFIKNIKQRHLILFAFIVALVSMLGSLYFSEIAGYTPCKLCWYQRILMYPQVFLLGQALWSKRKLFPEYLLPLNGLGIIVAFYHWILQKIQVSEIIDPSIPCTLAGGGCGVKYFFHLGYITIPFMALTGFVLIFITALIWKKKYSD